MYSEFGKFLRILRLNEGELLKDMADKLEVSSAFLSAVETGKKKIPDDWAVKISVKYNLDKTKTLELENSITLSKSTEKLNLFNNSPKNVQVALQFARRFNEKTISDKTLDDILKLLKRDKED